MGAAASFSQPPRVLGDITRLLHSEHATVCALIPEYQDRISAFIESPEEECSEIIFEIPYLLSLLLLIQGRRKALSKFNQAFFSNDECTYDISEAGEGNIVDVDDINNLAEEISCHALALTGAEYGINISCKEDLTDISILEPFLGDKMIYLNLSNSPVSVESMQKCTILQECLLQHLIISGTGIDMSAVMPCLPSCLLTLDLSYTEGFAFTPGMFMNCPQLIQLCLDGCGICSTVFPPMEGAGDLSPDEQHTSVTSVFFGLACLVYMSIKENYIARSDDLRGFEYFLVQTRYDDAPVNGTSESLTELKLSRVDIAENPLCEITTELIASHAVLVSSVPTLRRIDAKQLNVSLDSQGVVFVPSSVAGSGVGISTAMEKEFDAALRGDRENTVIA
jgi:hypothetical protein